MPSSKRIPPGGMLAYSFPFGSSPWSGVLRMKADCKSPKATSLWKLEAIKRDNMIEVVCGVGLARSSSK
eukprot:11191043-Lingulodinium_polyedra.AAC.1